MRCLLLLCCWFIALPALAAEKELLESHPKLFSRSGDVLTITLQNGKKKTFPGAELTGYRPKFSSATVKHGTVVSLISLASGNVLELAEHPSWSQNLFASARETEGNSFAVFGYCEKSGCKQVVRREGRYGAPKWTSKNTVKIPIRKSPRDGVEGRLECYRKLKSGEADCAVNSMPE